MHDRSLSRTLHHGPGERGGSGEPSIGKRTLTEQIYPPGIGLGPAAAATGAPDAAVGPGAPRAPRYNPFATHMGVAGAPAASGAGSAMPREVQHEMESAFATSFSDVRIHEDASADAMGARAYTRGRDIHFAPGEYQPATEAGQALLGHELAHVVQQSRGRVQATAQLRSVAVNDSPELEREADQAGLQAARGGRAGVTGGGPGGPASASTAPVQRAIKIGSSEAPVALDHAQEIAQRTDHDAMTEKLMQWYVGHLHADSIVHAFQDDGELADHVRSFVMDWKAGLAEIGITGDTSSSTSEMHKAFRIYNRDAPPNAEALIYKLDDKYQFLKQRWIAESGRAQGTHHLQGTIYDPPGGHTMPKNFAWISSVIHKQLPVRVVVPVDFRVLVREAVGEDLARELQLKGNRVVKDGKQMVEVNKQDVLDRLHDAPLSATAREVLGFVGNEFYRVKAIKQTYSRNETELAPTGKPLLNPREVFVPESMDFAKLVSLLGDRGITVQHDDLITTIHERVDQLAERRAQAEAADRRFKQLYWTTSAVVALASYVLGAYMGQWNEG